MLVLNNSDISRMKTVSLLTRQVIFCKWVAGQVSGN